MPSGSIKKRPFPSALEDAKSARLHIDSPQCLASSYSLAYQDIDFLLRDELRPVRLQLELLKPELILLEQHIESTVVIFGSARIPDPKAAEAKLVTAQAEYRQNKDDPVLARRVETARRALEKSRYYDEPTSDEKQGQISLILERMIGLPLFVETVNKK